MTEMTFCAKDDFDAADQELNRVWQKTLGTLQQELTPEDFSDKKKRLLVAQKSWLKFRDDLCAFYYKQGDFGSILQMQHLTCLTNATRDQIGQLKDASCLYRGACR